jgi:hypothetical protein
VPRAPPNLKLTRWATRPHSTLDVQVSISILKKASDKEWLGPIGECRCPFLDVTVSIHIADNRQNLVLMRPSTSYTDALPSLRISPKHLGVRQHTTEQRILPHPWHDSWAKLRCQTRIRRKHSTCARPGLRFLPARGAAPAGYDNTPHLTCRFRHANFVSPVFFHKVPCRKHSFATQTCRPVSQRLHGHVSTHRHLWLANIFTRLSPCSQPFTAAFVWRRRARDMWAPVPPAALSFIPFCR